MGEGVVGGGGSPHNVAMPVLGSTDSGGGKGFGGRCMQGQIDIIRGGPTLGDLEHAGKGRLPPNTTWAR